MKRKHKAMSGRRNLMLVALLVIVLGGLAGAVRWLNTAPPLIMPEGREEIAAKRQSPDNGYPLLEEAVKLFPPKPSRGAMPHPVQPNLQIPYTPESGSLSESLDVQRPLGDPEFTKYIHACDPLIAKVREAMARPFCLPLSPPTYFENGSADSVFLLTFVFAARGESLARYEGAPAEGLPYYLDALRFIRILANSDDASRSIFQANARITILSMMRRLARETLSPLEIEAFQRELRELGPPFPDRKAMLENAWRIHDDTLLQPAADYMRRFPESLFFRYSLWRLARSSRRVIEQRQFWHDLAQRCQSDFLLWIAREHPRFTHNPWSGWFDPAGRLMFLMARVCGDQADYQATRIALALERFNKEKGAYPESLAELLPAYIEELPQDPISCQPFGYQRKDPAYLLYSPGTDAKDNGGTPANPNHGSYFDYELISDIKEGVDQVFVAPPGGPAPSHL